MREWLDKARIHHARGEYETSLEYLEKVSELLPVLAEHSQFVSQKGYLEIASGKANSPYGRLVQAVEMESRGMLAEAESTFFEILDGQTHVEPWLWNGVTREAYRALIRAGLEDFNSGQNIRCHELFRILRDRCPNNLKVNIALQFAALRTDRPSECTEQVNPRLHDLQRFDALDSKGVRSLINANAARAHFLANNAEPTAKHHLRTIRP